MNKNQKSKNKKNKVFVIILSILLIILIAVALLLLTKIGFWKNTNSALIKPNTEVNGINISGLSKAEAYEAVSSYIKEKSQDFTLTLKYGDEINTLDKTDYEVNQDIHTIIDMANGKSQYEETLKSLEYFTTHGNSTQVAFNYIFLGLDEKIDNICSMYETPPIDSTIEFNPESENKFTITPSKSGTKVNKEKLYRNIQKQFELTNKVLVDIELEEASPKVTEEDNSKLTSLVSKFSTNVSDSTGGRKKNVKLALSKFNGMRIDPNETVSFNEITSPHSLSNGYEIATIILNGRFVDGVGGGICQASTTLYNALIRAGITINEVHKHSLPVRYVPLAQDAMVNENSSDLVFTNNLDSPIFISTSTTADDVTVEIYSKANEDGITYKLRSETIKTLPALPDKVVPDTNKEYTDKVLFKGEKYRLTYGREGYEVISYIQTWKDDEMLSEEKLRHEVYQPQGGTIIEGTADPIDNIPIIEENNVDNNTLDMDNNFLFSTTPSNLAP